MTIANPVYDVIFKFLMEDNESAITIISAILDKEIIELTPIPQEHIIYSEKWKLGYVRFDYVAIIKTKSGKYQKIIIEMQKAKNNDNAMRFRKYLAENYRKTDFIDGIEKPLPITSIYFLGYSVGVENAFICNKTELRDAISGVKVEGNMEFMELLSHDSFFILIDKLSNEQRKNAIFQLLTLFDQQYKNKDMRFLLERDDLSNISDPKIKHLVMRLHNAALEADLLEKAKLEEEFTQELDMTFAKLLREVEQERKMKEDEQKLREELQKMKEEERKLKEEAYLEIERLKALIDSQK
jgi:hypothetical protein